MTPPPVLSPAAHAPSSLTSASPAGDRDVLDREVFVYAGRTFHLDRSCVRVRRTLQLGQVAPQLGQVALAWGGAWRACRRCALGPALIALAGIGGPRVFAVVSTWPASLVEFGWQADAERREAEAEAVRALADVAGLTVAVDDGELEVVAFGLLPVPAAALAEANLAVRPGPSDFSVPAPAAVEVFLALDRDAGFVVPADGLDLLWRAATLLAG